MMFAIETYRVSSEIRFGPDSSEDIVSYFETVLYFDEIVKE